MAVVRLQSTIQKYAWGSKTWIAQCLNRTPSGEPEAELWMGAHPRSPSAVVDGLAEHLLALIESDRSTHLGSRVEGTFGRLPFLFKVLAADQPLSLQAHPTKEQAREGFERENAAGVDLSAPHRNYKDASDKPELIYALQPFAALSGFRVFDEAHALIDELSKMSPGAELDRFFEAFLLSPNGRGVEALFGSAFAWERGWVRGVIDKVVGPLHERLKQGKPLSSHLADYGPWLLGIAKRYPDDPGVLLTVLLNFVQLEVGQAMFLPAGNLHAYLRGLGLEVMANSDNVLRGGLTPKHVDVPELTRVLRFESFRPHVIDGQSEERDGVRWLSYGDHCPEFSLNLLELEGGSATVEGPAVGVVLEGCVDMGGTTLGRGSECFVSASSPERISGNGRVAWASVPDERS